MTDKTSRITIIVSQKEKEQIKTNAQQLGYNVSSYLRQLGTSKIYSPDNLPQLPTLVLQQKKHKGIRGNIFRDEQKTNNKKARTNILQET